MNRKYSKYKISNLIITYKMVSNMLFQWNMLVIFD